MSIKVNFFDYIGPAGSLADYQRSYKMVFLLSILMNIDRSGGARFYDVVNSFRMFYLSRKLQGLCPDIDVDPRIANIEHSTITQVWAVIKDNPYKVISDKGYIRMASGENRRSFCFSSELHAQMQPADYKRLKSLLEQKLTLYYSRIDQQRSGQRSNGVGFPGKTEGHATEDLVNRLNKAEAYYRKRHIEAIDVEDLAMAQTIQQESLEKIRKIKAFRAELLRLYDEISKSGLLDIPEEHQSLSMGKVITEASDVEDINGQQEATTEGKADEDNKKKSSLSGEPIQETFFGTLDEPSDPPPSFYTGDSPKLLTLLGRQYLVHQWQDVLTTVCEVMILTRPYKAAKFDQSESLNPDEQVNFSLIQSNIKVEPKRLSNGLWVEMSQGASDIIRLCNDMLRTCGYTTDVLEINVQEVG